MKSWIKGGVWGVLIGLIIYSGKFYMWASRGSLFDIVIIVAASFAIGSLVVYISKSEKIHKTIKLSTESSFFKNAQDVDFIFHLGARTDTVGQEPELYQQLNLIYINICIYMKSLIISHQQVVFLENYFLLTPII